MAVIEALGNGVSLGMSPLDKAKSERERLRIEAEEHRARLAQIEAELQDIDVFIRGWERFADKSAADTAPTLTPDSPFYGKGHPGAATLLLQMEGQEMTTTEITRGLQERGVEFATEDPVRAVDWALKRAAEFGHVIKVARALWVAGPSANPDSSDLQLNTRASRTRAGLELARKRGVRLGTPPKITEEHRLLAVSLFEQGKTMGEIAEACAVSRQTIVNRVKRWRDLGLFPKAAQSQPNQEPGRRDRGMAH
jgi:Homeodomain-like domain